MLKAVRESVHKMTSHLQLISGYLEMEDYAKALEDEGNHKGTARAGDQLHARGGGPQSGT